MFTLYVSYPVYLCMFVAANLTPFWSQRPSL